MGDLRHGSLIFDRAASFYDRTRGLSAAAQAALAEALVRGGGLAPGARVYEPGIGTGRIAVPLARRGLRVYGLDLSRPMLAQLARNVAGVAPAPRASEADVARVPFPDATFDAAVAVHVFHLVGPWRAALAEVRRVLRPGAVLFHGRDDDDDTGTPGERFRRHMHDWLEAHGLGRTRPGAQHGELEAALREMGERVETIEAARGVQRVTLRFLLEEELGRVHSHTWAIPEAPFAAYVADLSAWAEGEGRLDEPFEVRWRFEWEVWRFG